MRSNLPVTGHEHPVDAGVSIVSKTDLRGVITYANDAFVEISGYSRSELLGQPHNLLRHPDMPQQAFEHMWKTIKKGNPWKGIVKNRTKDGGFYWVKAVIVPVRKDDCTIGYMSVRQKATPEEIEEATQLYQSLQNSRSKIKENRLGNLMTIKTGFFLGSLFVIFLMLVGGILGIGGLMLSNSTVDTLHNSRIIPLAKTGQLDSDLQRLRTSLLAGGDRKELRDELRLSGARINRTLEELQSVPLDIQESGLRSLIIRDYQDLTEAANSLLNLSLSDASATGANLSNLSRYFDRTQERIHAFEAVIFQASKQNHAEMLKRNQTIWEIALGGLIVGVLVVLVVGRYFLRDIVTPLETAIENFDRIAQGNLNGEVEVYGKGETGHLIRASAVMQMHLKVITDEISLVAKGVKEHCSLLNNSLFEISDRSEIQHDRLSEAREVLSSSRDFASELEKCIYEIKSLPITAEGDRGHPDLAEITGLIERAENALHLQSFAFDDFQARIEQISDLIVDNRQDTQAAYAMSEQMRHEADTLYDLVSYFSDPVEQATVSNPT